MNQLNSWGTMAPTQTNRWEGPFTGLMHNNEGDILVIVSTGSDMWWEHGGKMEKKSVHLTTRWTDMLSLKLFTLTSGVNVEKSSAKCKIITELITIDNIIVSRVFIIC